MKNKISKSFGFLGLAALLLAATAHISVMGQEKDESMEQRTSNAQSHDRIVGAWQTVVTPRNCQTGEQVAPSFIGLLTFNKGGTLAEYGANPATPFRTPGHGIWQTGYRGEDSYLMDFTFIPLTPAGAPVGRLKVTQTMDYNRYTDESATIGSFQLTNLAGVVIGTGCSTSTATRFR